MTGHSDPCSDGEESIGNCGGLKVRVGQLNHPGIREDFLKQVTFNLDTER